VPLEDLTKAELILEHIELQRRIGELEILETERRRAEQALRDTKDWYRGLFENSPISLWVEDFSAVKRHLDGLREKGVEDFHRHLEENPQDVHHCAGLIKVVDVNQATLDLFGASSKSELLSDLGHIFTPQSWAAFGEILVALALGESAFEIETVNQKLSGEPIHIVLRWNLAPGDEDNRTHALVSVLDITKRKTAEEDRERYIEELKRARKTIERLTGVLPICASCKKIRDDRDNWHTVESFFSNHSEAKFSHSLCPECSDKLYPKSK
jgi:rsbT co-antagonist protein RsbR